MSEFNASDFDATEQARLMRLVIARATEDDEMYNVALAEIMEDPLAVVRGIGFFASALGSNMRSLGVTDKGVAQLRAIVLAASLEETETGDSK
jgi:hypothetical protein